MHFIPRQISHSVIRYYNTDPLQNGSVVMVWKSSKGRESMKPASSSTIHGVRERPLLKCGVYVWGYLAFAVATGSVHSSRDDYQPCLWYCGDCSIRCAPSHLIPQSPQYPPSPQTPAGGIAASHTSMSLSLWSMPRFPRHMRMSYHSKRNTLATCHYML